MVIGHTQFRSLLGHQTQRQHSQLWWTRQTCCLIDKKHVETERSEDLGSPRSPAAPTAAAPHLVHQAQSPGFHSNSAGLLCSHHIIINTYTQMASSTHPHVYCTHIACVCKRAHSYSCVPELHTLPFNHKSLITGFWAVRWFSLFSEPLFASSERSNSSLCKLVLVSFEWAKPHSQKHPNKLLGFLFLTKTKSVADLVENRVRIEFKISFFLSSGY